MLRTTFAYLSATPFIVPVQKTRDARQGLWNVVCTLTEFNDEEITFTIHCKDWLDTTFTLPTPIHMDTLYECIYLSISEMIVQERIEYLCGAK